MGVPQASHGITHIIMYFEDRSRSDDDRIISHDAPHFMLYYHCVRDIMISDLQHARNQNIAVLDVVGFQTCFGSAASAFEIIELAYVLCVLKENFSVTLTKKGFTCVSLICREQLVRSPQLNTKYKTRQLMRFTRFTRRTKA